MFYQLYFVFALIFLSSYGLSAYHLLSYLFLSLEEERKTLMSGLDPDIKDEDDDLCEEAGLILLTINLIG